MSQPKSHRMPFIIVNMWSLVNFESSLKKHQYRVAFSVKQSPQPTAYSCRQLTAVNFLRSSSSWSQPSDWLCSDRLWMPVRCGPLHPSVWLPELRPWDPGCVACVLADVTEMFTVLGSSPMSVDSICIRRDIVFSSRILPTTWGNMFWKPSRDCKYE